MIGQLMESLNQLMALLNQLMASTQELMKIEVVGRLKRPSRNDSSIRMHGRAICNFQEVLYCTSFISHGDFILQGDFEALIG